MPGRRLRFFWLVRCLVAGACALDRFFCGGDTGCCTPSGRRWRFNQLNIINSAVESAPAQNATHSSVNVPTILFNGIRCKQEASVDIQSTILPCGMLGGGYPGAALTRNKNEFSLAAGHYLCASYQRLGKTILLKYPDLAFSSCIYCSLRAKARQQYAA